MEIDGEPVPVSAGDHVFTPPLLRAPGPLGDGLDDFRGGAWTVQQTARPSMISAGPATFAGDPLAPFRFPTGDAAAEGG